MKLRSRLALGLLLLGVLLVPPNIFSSGSWVEATFVLKRQPDEPMKAFDGGKLGILWPKFDRRYLVIAYRYLEQRPLTAQERHSLDGKKERVAGMDPVGVIQRESTGGDHAMDMGMMLEPLIPGVQHAEETDLGAQVSGLSLIHI